MDTLKLKYPNLHAPSRRLVLSACSDFFRTVLRGMGSGVGGRNSSSSQQNPVLYLRGVTYTDLEAVLNFMYHGEANVAQVTFPGGRKWSETFLPQLNGVPDGSSKGFHVVPGLLPRTFQAMYRVTDNLGDYFS